MRAVVFDEFGGRLRVIQHARPVCPPDGVVLRVRATGLCRSDWHGWMGHDADIVPPHVPGHEFAGVIDEVGPLVAGWSVGQRVTAPFVFACGRCVQCASGNQQVCTDQQQAGFTHDGSFAEYVVVDRAQVNLVALPDGVDFDTAAVLGCRFATAYRAVRQVARVRAGERVAVFGCGGVGLSAVMIAAAAGAQVTAVDVNGRALELALSFGAAHTVRAAEPWSLRGGSCSPTEQEPPRNEVGFDVAVEALGSVSTAAAALRCLCPRGRMVQVGLLPDPTTPLPMGPVIAKELTILGSHGLAAHVYPQLLAEIAGGELAPQRLIGSVIGLDEACQALPAMTHRSPVGVTVIRP